MKNFNRIKSIVIPLLLILVSCFLSYLIFNLFVFIIVTILLMIITPIVFAIITCNTEQERLNLSAFEITMCIIFSVLITGFNNLITESDKFKRLIIPYLSNNTVSIQEFNVMTYILAIVLFIGIYYVTVKKVQKKRRNRNDR